MFFFCQSSCQLKNFLKIEIITMLQHNFFSYDYKSMKVMCVSYKKFVYLFNIWRQHELYFSFVKWNTVWNKNVFYSVIYLILSNPVLLSFVLILIQFWEIYINIRNVYFLIKFKFIIYHFCCDKIFTKSVIYQNS